MRSSLSDILLLNVKRYAANIALQINDVRLTYAELYHRARPLIQYLQREKPHRAAILMDRGINSYISIFACVIAEVAYVPIVKTMDKSLIEYIFSLTQTHFVITDQDFSSELDVIMTAIHQPITCIILEQLSRTLDYAPVYSSPAKPTNDNPHAYIMMTSGSTGKPKAVAVGYEQLMHYINSVKKLYSPCSSEHFSQIVDLTFDLSAHDVFLCWTSGACLFPFCGNNYLALASFLEKNKITFSMMVPSMAVALERCKQLQPKIFQTIKTLSFCGEPLPNNIVQKIFKIAPHIRIENIYGPTEASIAFTSFSCQKDDLNVSADTEYKVTPIGKAFPDLRTKIVNGELWLGGIQVVDGYLNLPHLTEEKFVEKDGVRWYKSGDLASEDAEGNLHYKGRIDDQWQVRGERVERLALERQFKNFLSKSELVLIPSPVTPEGLVIGIALIFVSENEEEEIKVKKLCQKNCVAPFIPTAYIPISALPLNSNGKIDYKMLRQHYQKIVVY